MLPLLAKAGVTTTVTPLYYLEHNPQLALLPADRMGRVLDPCTQLRQKPWGDRAKGFRALGFGNEPEPYEPDRARLTDRELIALALEPLDAQRSRGGTLLLTTFHVAGPADTRGRDIKLTLAGIAIEQFRRERMDELPPHSQTDIPREIFATLAIRVEDLISARGRRRLAEQYLSLNPDGYWVKIVGYHERASLRAIRAGSAFLSALREGGRPVGSCGPGQLHLALLADEISSKYRPCRKRAVRDPSNMGPSKEGRQAQTPHEDGLQPRPAVVVQDRIGKGPRSFRLRALRLRLPQTRVRSHEHRGSPTRGGHTRPAGSGSPRRGAGGPTRVGACLLADGLMEGRRRRNPSTPHRDASLPSGLRRSGCRRRDRVRRAGRPLATDAGHSEQHALGERQTFDHCSPLPYEGQLRSNVPQ